MNFENYYDNYVLEESIKNIIASPKTIIATAVLLGLIDYGYTFPKMFEIGDKVKQQLREKDPEVVKRIEQKAVEIQNSPKVQKIYSEIQKTAPKNAEAGQEMLKKAITPPKQKQVAPIDTNKGTEFLKKAMEYIRKNELGEAGIEYHKMYKDHKGYNTIGVGHLVTKEELPTYENKTLSEKEVLDLFEKDSKKKLATARRLFPKYDTYNDELKIALLDGIFRGDVSGSPNTIKLINKGMWRKAAEEFLDNAEYRQSVKEGTGVAPRMRKIAKVIANQSNKK